MAGFPLGHISTNVIDINSGSTEPLQGIQTQDEISFYELFEILLKHKWIVLFFYTLVLSSVALYTHQADPVYQASSLVFISPKQSGQELGALLGFSSTNRNISNEIEIIKSRTISLSVAGMLQEFDDAPGLKVDLSILEQEENGPPVTQSAIAGRLRNGVYMTVEPVNPEVDMIVIRSRSTYPREAALISELYAEAYTNYNLNQSRKRISAGREFLQEQTARFDTLLAESESAILQYSEDEGIVDPELEATYMIEQVMDLESERYKTQFVLRAAQSEYQTIEAELDRITPGLAQALASNDDESIVAIRRRITEVQLLIADKLSKNPSLRNFQEGDEELREWNQKIEDYESDLVDRSERFAARLLSSGSLSLGQNASEAMTLISRFQLQAVNKRIEMSGAQARLDVLDQNISDYQSSLDRIPNKAILMARYERNMETSAQLYSTVFQNLQEARIAEESEQGYVEIIDYPVVPAGPVGPRIPFNLMAGFAFGSLLGLGAAFGRHTLDNKIRKPDDLRQKMFSVLGVVSNMERSVQSDFEGKKEVDLGGTTFSTTLVTLLNPLSPIAENFRRLRTNLQFSVPDKNIEVILVTSSEPGEGKTSISMNLAIALAQSGKKTIFVDADMRRPTSHRLIGRHRQPGLTDLLFDESNPNFESFRSGIDDLHFLPVGEAAPNPAELLGSERMKRLIENLRSRFDVVILDSPPVLSVTDALSLSKISDATVMVCSANETHMKALEQARDALGHVGTNVTGVILNRFDVLSAYGGYAYNYGYSYGYGYGYGYGNGDGSGSVTTASG